MRYLILSVLAAILLAGCNEQQQKQADQASQTATAKAGEALNKGKIALANSTLAMKVKSAIGASPRLDSSHITVSADGKMVHLEGTVPTTDDKTMAESIARSMVEKDISVMNFLVVVKAEKK